MIKKPHIVLSSTAVLSLSLAQFASAGAGSNTGPFGFEPIAVSAAGNGSDFNPSAPWIIPEGFTQFIVSDESDLNIYLEPTQSGGRSNDWNDMNTVNETGRKAGRYLYRTHEVRGSAGNGGTGGSAGTASGGAAGSRGG